MILLFFKSKFKGKKSYFLFLIQIFWKIVFYYYLTCYSQLWSFYIQPIKLIQPRKTSQYQKPVIWDFRTRISGHIQNSQTLHFRKALQWLCQIDNKIRGQIKLVQAFETLQMVNYIYGVQGNIQILKIFESVQIFWKKKWWLKFQSWTLIFHLK